MIIATYKKKKCKIGDWSGSLSVACVNIQTKGRNKLTIYMQNINPK